MCGDVGDGGVGGWRVHGVGAYPHPPVNSYNVKIFNFMNTHHLPTHPIYPVSLCHYTYTLEGLWDGWWWVVGGFMGWVGVWWCGWLESSWVGEYMHPPHPGVLGMMGRWAWV